MSLRILVADDSIIFRRVIADVLAGLPNVEVVGAVSNGRAAVDRVRELRPDILTLDMEMPQMGGLEVLDALRAAGETVVVLVVSAITRRGGQLTIRALEKGAFDFITKPDTSNAEVSRELLRQELAPRVRSLAHRLEIRNILRSGGKNDSPTTVKTAVAAPAVLKSPAAGLPAPTSLSAGILKPDLVLIGVSTGGPVALARVMPELPKDLGVPVLIVQHMPAVFTQSLAESLASKCRVAVREASDGEVIEPNAAYIAPGGKQMRVVPGTNGNRTIQITDDPPENNCRPAVDYLFRSVANNFPGRAMAVILTGMGNDGTLGLRLLKRRGCYVIAQNEATCVVYGMPKAAVEAGVTDDILPLEAIPGRITAAVRGWRS